MTTEILRAPLVSNRWAKIFQAAMWIGIAQNLVMAVPAFFFPATILRWLGQTVPHDLTWVSAAALTLVFLACMYIPAAWNPMFYRWTTWLSIFARIPGVLFFWAWHPGHYPLFGWIDLLMIAIQLPLWLLTLNTPTRPLRD